MSADEYTEHTLLFFFSSSSSSFYHCVYDIRGQTFYLPITRLCHTASENVPGGGKSRVSVCRAVPETVSS